MIAAKDFGNHAGHPALGMVVKKLDRALLDISIPMNQ
jgi:hypothetical protein